MERIRGYWGLLIACSVVLAIAFIPVPSHSEWVSGQVTLNLRTGPGSEFRIVGSLKTGDQLRVLKREKRWTQIKLTNGRTGWVPAGFISGQPPADIRLSEVENELTKLKSELATASTAVDEFRAQNETLRSRDAELSETNRRLDVENRDLKAGARWPEWITGASILAAGMLVGALLQSWSSRRPQPRIRF